MTTSTKTNRKGQFRLVGAHHGRLPSTLRSPALSSGRHQHLRPRRHGDPRWQICHRWPSSLFFRFFSFFFLGGGGPTTSFDRVLLVGVPRFVVTRTATVSECLAQTRRGLIEFYCFVFYLISKFNNAVWAVFLGYSSLASFSWFYRFWSTVFLSFTGFFTWFPTSSMPFQRFQ